jgi:hypothetical protein
MCFEHTNHVIHALSMRWRPHRSRGRMSTVATTCKRHGHPTMKRQAPQGFAHLEMCKRVHSIICVYQMCKCAKHQKNVYSSSVLFFFGLHITGGNCMFQNINQQVQIPGAFWRRANQMCVSLFRLWLGLLGLQNIAEDVDGSRSIV